MVTMSRLNRDFQWAIIDKQYLLRARFLHLIMNMPGPGVEPPTSGMPSWRANHYTTAPLWQCLTLLYLSANIRRTPSSLSSNRRTTIYTNSSKTISSVARSSYFSTAVRRSGHMSYSTSSYSQLLSDLIYGYRIYFSFSFFLHTSVALSFSFIQHFWLISTPSFLAITILGHRIAFVVI